MPAAAPLPRGPSVLTLYSAADLLTAPGCPVCRYAAEASDRYFGWFALEGHAEPTMIASLGKSAGMCARHTRRLMSQPGAATRLTAVFRYVLMAARDRLAGSTGPMPACPACQHDDAAADRALGTLLDGLGDLEAMSRYRDLGGLCVPHLADVAASAYNRFVPTLADIQREALSAGPATPQWLAAIDPDAEIRAVLRRVVPAAGSRVPAACEACLAAAQAERDALERLPTAAGGMAGEQPLCASHLADAALAAGEAGRLRGLLGAQIASLASGRAGRKPGRTARLHRGRGAAGTLAACAVCQSRGSAEQAALAGILAGLRGSLRLARPTLCVRHHLTLRSSDRRASLALGQDAVQAAGVLIDRLAEAFDRMTEARRAGVTAPEATAWRHAAAFLDGDVFGGCPAQERA